MHRGLVIGWIALLVVGLIPVNAPAAEDAPFSHAELLRFIRTVPGFLERYDPMAHPGDFGNLLKNPGLLGQYPKARGHLETNGWTPERFVYVLNHVILGGVMYDMGGQGEKQIQTLMENRNKALGDPGLSAEEKERRVKEIDECLNRLRETTETIRSIPRSELMLMWRERDALNQVLMGKLPIQPRGLPSH